MARSTPNTETEWVDAIADRAENELENFTPNSQWREATLEVFEETYRYGGAGALNELGETAFEILDYKRHPKSHRLRLAARSILINEFDVEPPATSSLLTASH